MRRWKTCTALVVAYLLVFQLLILGVAVGAQASVVGSAGADGILCTASGAHSSDAPTEDDRGHIGQCCTVGCPMLGGLGLAPPLLSPGGPADFAFVTRLAAPQAACPDPKRAGSSFSARAPPAVI